jgi:hypothetical protein
MTALSTILFFIPALNISMVTCVLETVIVGGVFKAYKVNIYTFAPVP